MVIKAGNIVRNKNNNQLYRVAYIESFFLRVGCVSLADNNVYVIPLHDLELVKENEHG